MKKIFYHSWLAIGIMTLIVLVSACSNESDTSSDGETDVEETSTDEITVRMHDDPDFFDPHKATASISFQMILNMFEGLLATDTDGTIKPAIAEEHDISDDGLTYTFTIREDVMFHNGDPITIDDIKYSFERLTGANNEEPLSAEFEGIDSLDSPDDQTFVITLKEPNSNFLYTLTALNAAIIPEANDGEHNENPIGTGPFQFVNYQPDAELNLEKHDEYWQEDLPYLNKLNFVFQTDSETAILSMQAGEVDLMNIPAHRIPEVEDEFELNYQESNSSLVIAFNNEVEPFDDLKVRQAINYAISKDDIIESAYSGYAAKLGSNMSPAMGDFYLDGLEEEYEHNPEKAKELLEEAGYPDGFDTTITISSHESMYADIAQVAVENLKEIGIDVDIEVVEWGIWLDEVYDNKNYELTTIDITGKPSAYEILNDYISTNDSENFFQFNNPEFDELMTDVLKEDDLDQQIEKYHRAQEVLSEEAAAVFVADYQFIWMLNPDLEGTKYYPFYFHDMSEVRFTE